MRRWMSLAVLLVALVMAGDPADANTPRRFEDETQDYYDLVVTATRTPEARETIGSSVTVISAKDLEQRREMSVIEYLRSVPGVVVTTSGGPGTTSSIRIRGANDVHTLVLLDGVRVHSNTLGTAAIQSMTIDNIDRIEIVRGPQSVLYGSDAMGGVIQIFTKRGRENRTTVSYEGGAYNTNSARASTSGTSGNQSYSIAGSWQEVGGYSRYSAWRLSGPVEEDGYRNKSASVSWDRRGWLDLGASLWFSESIIDLDNSSPTATLPADDRDRWSQNRDWSAAFNLSRRAGDRWRHQAAFTGFRDEQVGNTGAEFRILSVTRAAKWQSEFRMTDGLTLVGGFESEKQVGESYNAGVTRFAKSTITNSGFLEGVFGFGNFHLTLGGRHDNHSSFGDHNTWRTTAAWTGIPRTRLYGSFGTGFKAPTFNQLYFPGSGQTNLEPEESKGWDAGIEHSLFEDRFVVRATWFDNDFENLIEFAAPTFVARNVARAKSHGLELSATARILDNLSLDAQYTHLEARDEVSNLRLSRRPRNVFTAHLGYRPWSAVDLDLYYRNVGPSYSATGERSRVDGHDVLAAVLAVRFKDRHKIWCRGENILDEQYEEVYSFGTPRASVYGGYEYSF